MRNVKGKNNPNYKHGIKSKQKRLYNIWCNMKQRCLNVKHPKYNRYGGRGITICEEWLNIENFYNWSMNNGYNDNLTIDRIDNNKGYSPDNCRWVSISENSRKKSTTKIDMILAQEIRMRIKEDWTKLAKEYNCSHGTIWFIMKNFTHVPDGQCTKKLKERKKVSLCVD